MKNILVLFVCSFVFFSCASEKILPIPLSPKTYNEYDYRHTFISSGRSNIIEEWKNVLHTVTSELKHGSSGTRFTQVSVDGVITLDESDSLCYGVNDGYLMDVRDKDAMPMLFMRHSCHLTEDTGFRDIFYNGALLSKELQVDEVLEAFQIQNHWGYVTRKGADYYVLYNNIIASPNYTSIQTEACCAMPSYYSTDENSVSFLARRDEQLLLVRIEPLTGTISETIKNIEDIAL